MLSKNFYKTDIYKTLHPVTDEYTFFSSAQGSITKTVHILGNKTSLNKFKRIHNIPSII